MGKIYTLRVIFARLLGVLRPLKPLCRLVPTARPLDIVPSVISKYHALKASCQWLAFLLAKKQAIDCLLWRGRKSAPTDIVPEGLNRPWGRWRKPVGESSAGRTYQLRWYISAHFVKGVEGNPLAHALQNAKYSVLYFAILCIRQIATLVSKKRQKAIKKRGRGGKGGSHYDTPPCGRWSLVKGYCLKTNSN